MQTVTSGPLTKNMLTRIALAFEPSAKKITFLTSLVVTNAKGYVRIKTDNDHNYIVEIYLSGLAELTALQPPRQTYVVWMITDQDITKNIAQINSSTGFLSRQLTASFQTVSSFKPSKIFITAEDDVDILFPGSQVILSTDSF